MYLVINGSGCDGYFFYCFSAYIETKKYGRFRLPAETEGFHVWKVDVGILTRWKDATQKGKEEILQLIQMGNSTYLGIETTGSKNSASANKHNECTPQVGIEASTLIEPAQPNETAQLKICNVEGKWR